MLITVAGSEEEANPLFCLFGNRGDGSYWPLKAPRQVAQASTPAQQLGISASCSSVTLTTSLS